MATLIVSTIIFGVLGGGGVWFFTKETKFTVLIFGFSSLIGLLVGFLIAILIGVFAPSEVYTLAPEVLTSSLVEQQGPNIRYQTLSGPQSITVGLPVTVTKLVGTPKVIKTAIRPKGTWGWFGFGLLVVGYEFQVGKENFRTIPPVYFEPE